MTLWAALALVSGGLFAGSVLAFAWDRVSAWRTMAITQFMADFDHTINKADRIQPAILAVAIASSVGFAVTSSGSPRILALVAAAGFFVVMVASWAVLVPLQRRILRTNQDDVGTIESMRARWFPGHIGRTMLSLVSFVLISIAVVQGLTAT